MWLFVPVANPSMQRTDLVQSFTEALTAEENIWLMELEHLATSFRSITPSSAVQRVSGAVQQQVWSQPNGADGILGEKSDSLRVFHWQQRGGVRQQAAEPRLTLLQGRARARGQRSRGNEVRQNSEKKKRVQAVIYIYIYLSGGG